MRPAQITTSTLTDDVDGIAEAQTLGGAGNVALDGALVIAGVAFAAEAQIVSITSVGNDSGITFTITGDDPDGKSVSETITGANADVAVTTNYFQDVSQIAASGATAADITAGWVAADGAVTKSVPVSWRGAPPFNMSMFVHLLPSTTLTYTVEHTESDPGPRQSYATSFANEAVWRPTIGIQLLSSDAEGNIAFPVQAVRAKITAYTSGQLAFTVIQSN